MPNKSGVTNHALLQAVTRFMQLDLQPIIKSMRTSVDINLAGQSEGRCNWAPQGKVLGILVVKDNTIVTFLPPHNPKPKHKRKKEIEHDEHT